MTILEIFDVEHGQCSLVSFSSGAHLLIDCGHNSSSGWRPSSMLAYRSISRLDQLVITNCDEDHASDLVKVRETVSIDILSSNPTVSGADLFALKSNGCMGAGITELCKMTSHYGSPVTSHPDFDGMTYELFWNSYPDDFDDENNLSLVMVLRWPDRDGVPGFSICFGGDMEGPGWRRLLRRTDFVLEMSKGITVFVASHHGRSNGYCRELFDVTGIQPVAVVISDGGLQYATQATIADYRRHTVGFDLNGTRRHVLTTRRDGRITFGINPGRVTTVETG